MPGYAWGIPAQLCKTGSQLALIEGTPCYTCYALKGRFLWPNVRKAYQNRYDHWLNTPQDDWIDQMVELINNTGQPEFRWFDSGDLQNNVMFNEICEIAKRTPDVMHWVPTQERLLVKNRDTNIQNLVYRVSATMIGGLTPKGYRNTSRIAPKVLKSVWHKLVARNTKSWHHCPAPLQNNECGDCRACWDPEVMIIVYLEH